MLGVIDVSRVVIKRRQRTNYATEYCHGVGVGTKPFEKAAQLLIDHRVMLDGVNKFDAFLSIWQFTIQQTAQFQIVRLLGQLLNWITTVQ